MSGVNGAMVQQHQPGSKPPLGVGENSVGKSYKRYTNNRPVSPKRSLKTIREERGNLVRVTSTLTKLQNRLTSLIEQVDGVNKLPRAVITNLQHVYQQVVTALGYLDDVKSNSVEVQEARLQELFCEVSNLLSLSKTGSLLGTRLDPIHLSDFLNHAYSQATSVNLWSKEETIKLTAEEESLKKERSKKKRKPIFGSDAEEFSSSNNKSIHQFFEGVKDKGWKINDGVEELVANGTLDENAFDEGFEASCTAVTDIKKSKTLLLDRTLPIGIVRFPILAIRNPGTITETVIRDLVKARLGYEVHKVYSGYLVIDNVLLIGVRRDFMPLYKAAYDPSTGKVEGWLVVPNGNGKNGTPKIKTRVELRKFEALLPYLLREYSYLGRELQTVGPVNPSMLHGDHYYTPLFPDKLAKSGDFSMGAWSLLTDDQKA